MGTRAEEREDDDLRRRVRQEWLDVAARLGTRPPQDASPSIEVALWDYTRPERHYHNLRHIVQCLNELRRVRRICADAEVVTAALIFHDCVYDPTRPDNEARSAGVAAAALRGTGVQEDRVAAVERLILATRHTALPAAGDEAVIVDIDLSILGQPPAVFDEYEAAIRREYAHVSDADFRAGRAKVLRRFLDRPSVYATAPFRRRYEAAARQNLTRSLARLEGA